MMVNSEKMSACCRIVDESPPILDLLQADIFSIFTITLYLLHGRYPATWTPEELSDEVTEFEDMERAISVYSISFDPLMRPTA